MPSFRQKQVVLPLSSYKEQWLKWINPTCKYFVVNEGRTNVSTIYSEAIKALYGTVDASKLFVDNLTLFLVNDLGFTSSHYDEYVINKIINRQQCTIS